jgi:hypothetical protein
MNDSKQAELRAGLERVIQRARVEAEVGAPARMVALYVELEARHALDGHGRAINGVDCQLCVERVHADRMAPETQTAL